MPEADSLFSALDLPAHVHDLQAAYWIAERRWRELRRSYERVLADMLDDAVSPPAVESGSGEA